MPVPSLITDLSQTAGSNYPSGGDSPSTLDDVQRAHASFIAQLRDGKGQSAPVSLASAATVDIGAQNSQFVEITGTTGVTSFGTTYNGPRYLRFQGVLTITHNSTTLNLPGASNVTTAAGDVLVAEPNLALNGWNVVGYQRAALAPGAASTVPANLDFTGTGNRITGDFSNATVANRVMFQTSTVNGSTNITAIPNGTSTTAAYGVTNSSDVANASFLNMLSSSTEVSFRSVITGTGTYLPMTFYTGGSERVRISTNGDTKPYYTNSSTVSTTSTFSYSVGTHGQVCLITFTNAITVTFGAPANITEGAMYKFILKAGDTSARTYAWNSAYKFPAATAPLTSGTTTNGAFDVITFIGGASNTLIYDGHTADLR